MNRPRWIVLVAAVSSLSLLGMQAPPPIPIGSGQLHLRLIGNGKICARLHEPEVVEKISPDRMPNRLFTTYGYRFRLTAYRQGSRPQLFVLLDSGSIRTYKREKTATPPKSRNPLPGQLRSERGPAYRDLWMKHSACRSFPRFKEIELPEGDYVLGMEYRVRSPNGTWFTVMEQKSAPVEIRAGKTSECLLRFLDDGNRREIFFYNPAEAEDGETPESAATTGE